MKRKIAFFDIDGTMVNVPNGLMHPTSETVRVLREFRKQGNYIVVATARGMAPDSVKNIEFDGYIFNDGHYIIFNDEVLIEELFLPEDIEKQIKVYEKYNGRYMFNGHEDVTWNRFLDDPIVIKHRLMFNGTDKRPEKANDIFEVNDVQAISCCVLFDNVEDMWSSYHELKNEYTIVPYDSGLIRMDVYRKGFTKGTGCEYLYKKLNIDHEDTYAFGDGINDKQMIQLVKHGIAMGNAIEEIKEVAFDVTDTVDNDGIAKAFKKYLDI